MLIVNLCFGFSLSAEKSPDNPMLGRREIVDGKVRSQQLNKEYQTFNKNNYFTQLLFCSNRQGNMCGKLTKKYMI